LINLSQKIYQHFSVQLSVSEMLKISNIRLIAEAIDKKYRLIQPMLITKNKISLFQIQEGNINKRLPIIFIHPAGGTTFCYRELIAKFDEDQPCYLIEDASLSGKKILWNTLSEMATYYLQLIEKHMPQMSEIILSGWSFGGMVAVE